MRSGRNVLCKHRESAETRGLKKGGGAELIPKSSGRPLGEGRGRAPGRARGRWEGRAVSAPGGAQGAAALSASDGKAPGPEAPASRARRLRGTEEGNVTKAKRGPQASLSARSSGRVSTVCLPEGGLPWTDSCLVHIERIRKRLFPYLLSILSF